MIKLRLQGTLAECVRKATTTCSGAAGDYVPGTPQDDVVLELEARSVTEALRLVVPQAPGMDWALRFGSWRVTVDGKPVGPGELDMRLADRAYVSVAPAVAGDGPAAAGIAPWVYWTIVGVTVASAVWAISQIPSIPDTDHLDETGERRRLFSGPVNSIAQGGAVPLIYGRTRVGSTVVSGGVSQERPTGGDHAAPDELGLGGDRPPGAERPGRDDRGRDAEAPRQPDPAGAASEERSVLRVVDLLGEGEIEGLAEPGLRSVFIDGIAVEDSNGDRTVDGVSVQIRRGLAHGAVGQEPLAGFDWTSTGLTHDRTKVEHGSPAAARIPGDDYDAARVTLRFPALFRQDESGDEVAAEVQVRIESRPVGGAWASVLLQTIRDLSTGPQEVSWRVERPDGVDEDDPGEIRVSRVTPDSDSLRVSDEVWWERLSGLRDVKQTYPHTAVAGLVIETDRSELNPTRREYEVKGRRVLAPPASIWNPNATATSAATYGAGLWDGTMRRVWTDNPAWILYDLLTDRRAGLGGVPGMVDAVRAARAEFLELSRRCDALVPAPNSDADTEPRWRFNGVIKRREQARKMIDWATSACRAGVSWAEGAAALAIDGESDVAAAVGNANVVDGEFEYSGLRWQERYSAAAVTWQDPDDDYRSGVELVVSDELVARHGFRQQDIAAVGCTSRGQAHRLGLLALSEQETESENVRFRMALEGMHLRPGDRIRIADERRFEARAAWRVVEVDTSVAGQETVSLDGPAPRLVAGGTIVWGASGSAAVTGTVAEPTKIVTTDVPTGLSAGDLVLNEAGAIDWVVSEVRERDQVEVEVEARRHHPGKYSAVEQRRELAPPLVDPVASLLPPTSVTARERTYKDRNQVRSLLEIAVEGGDDPRISQVEYQIQRPLRPATAAEITAGDWTVLPRGPWEPLRITAARSIVERDVALGGYRLRARFLSRRRRSAWATSDPLLVDGKTDAGGAPSGLTAQAAIGGYWVQWAAAPDADYAYTEVYDRPGQPGAADADVDVDEAGWVERGRITGSGWRRVDVSEEDEDTALRVAVRHVDTSGLATAAREVGVTPGDAIAGADGVDGAGVEYAFMALATNQDPEIPAGADSWLYDEPQGGWTDGASANLSPALPWLQRIDRAVPGSPAVGTSPVDDDGNLKEGWGRWRLSGRWRGYALGEQARNVSVTARSGGGSSATTTWTNPAAPPPTWRLVITLHVGATQEWRSKAVRYVAGGAANASMEHSEPFISPQAVADDLVTVEISPASGTAPNYAVGGGILVQAITAAPALGTPVPTVTGGDGYLDTAWAEVAGATSSTTYEIWYSSVTNDPGTPQITGITGTSRRITGLVNDTLYWVRVRARDGTSTSNWSSSFVSGTPTAECPAVTTAGPRPTVSVAHLTATISWAPDGEAASYKVYVDGSLHETVTDPTTSVTYAGTAGTHSARVAILNSCGNEGPQGTARSFTLTDPPQLAWGSWSDVSQATSPADIPIRISDISDANIEADGALGAWSKVGAPGYPAGGTAGIWAGGGTYGVVATYSVVRNGSVDVIQALQSWQSIANIMRDPDTDSYFRTDAALLNPSGNDLENYHSPDFDFVSAVRTDIGSRPSGVPQYGFAVVSWKRNGTAGAGTLAFISPYGDENVYLKWTRDYE